MNVEVCKHREKIIANFFVDLSSNMLGSSRDLQQQLKPMKIGDDVYLITDKLQTGAGIPATLCAIQDSTVEVGWANGASR